MRTISNDFVQSKDLQEIGWSLDQQTILWLNGVKAQHFLKLDVMMGCVGDKRGGGVELTKT